MSTPPAKQARVFFAYGGQQPLVAEAMRDAVTACNNRGLDARGWEQLQVGGRIIISEVTRAIDESSTCVAEIGSANPNVLFEAGYALAREKRILFAIDESDSQALRNWTSLNFIRTIGRLDYTGNPERLANQISDAVAVSEPPLIESLLANAKPIEENALFAPGTLHKFNTADQLEKMLQRKTYLKLIASEEEVGLATLNFYVEEIYRSSAAILHFMAPQRLRSSEYNARLALLAGIIHGLGKPLLMVAEPQYKVPLDYQDMLYSYSSSSKVLNHVQTWLDSLPTEPGSKKRLGRLKLDVEMPIATFGRFVAEQEAEELSDYFVPTNEFSSVLGGTSSVFLGRKGTGKSATMQQAVEELRKDRRFLVVPIKPSSYELDELTSLIDRFQESSKRDYFLVTLWCYLLVTEIALRAISHAESLPAGTGASSSVADLADCLDGLQIDSDVDVSARLDRIVEETQSESKAGTSDLNAMTEKLRQHWQTLLLPRLKPVLAYYTRVAVLVDNLDKTWESGVNFENLSRFLLALLTTSGKLGKEIERRSASHSKINLTLTVFLRTDIYDVMSKYAREPDKIAPQKIHWQDEELLIRVLEDRYVANRRSKRNAAPEGLWESVFCSEVRSMPTRDYLLWRSLKRPRDLIAFSNNALTTAINRKHGQVQAPDFLLAEDTYSQFAVEALLVESEAQGFDLDTLLPQFAGLDSTIEEQDLLVILGEAPNAQQVVQWLVMTGFLGVEARDGSFVHVEGRAEADKKMIAARRMADRMGRPMNYRIHPAYRPYLDIRDDDIHSDEL